MERVHQSVRPATQQRAEAQRPSFYIESESVSAKKIWKASGVPTLCYQTMKFYLNKAIL